MGLKVVPDPEPDEETAELERQVTALQAKVEELKEAAKEAEEENASLRADLYEAGTELEDALGAALAADEQWRECFDVAERLHREAKHDGSLRFCADRICTTWADLFRDNGVEGV